MAITVKFHDKDVSVEEHHSGYRVVWTHARTRTHALSVGNVQVGYEKVAAWLSAPLKYVTHDIVSQQGRPTSLTAQ